MDVYHNGNGTIWEQGRRGQKLAEFPIRRTFLWEKRECFLPAVYVGSAGAVLDLCTKIPTENILAFLKKWDEKRRLSLKTQEDYEQIDADNPTSREYMAQMRLNGSPLACSCLSSLRWYPPDILPHWQNDRHADTLITSYGCDKKDCWHLTRLVYGWKEEPVLSPQSISLLLQERPHSASTVHFTTDSSCGGETIKTTHPATGQEYTLTLHKCTQVRHSFADIGAEGVTYPEYCCQLSYSVSPEISRDLFDLRDCADSDKPRQADAPDEHTEKPAAALFMAGKNPAPDSQIAFSSLHFEPVPKVRWRAVFQVKSAEDMEISFPIMPCGGGKRESLPLFDRTRI